MTTNQFLNSVISIVADLSQDISASQRFNRLLDVAQTIFPCDAIALLKAEGDFLIPMAASGLSSDSMGRHFEISHHPRFQKIIDKHSITHFPVDSILPDPYDGLIAAHQTHTNVHDCLGVPLYNGNKLWGLLTLDAIKPGTFEKIDNAELSTFISLTEAVVQAAETMDKLKNQFKIEQSVKLSLIKDRKEPEFIGNSTAIINLKEELDVVAQSHLTVLILGETGVGKELVASYIHRKSPRSKQPLVYINCAALPINIAESELFGHVKGSYSGATSDRAGKFEIADGATLFLDEIGELPLELQAKMLRVLQNGEIQRIGYDKHIEVDVRIIAATNRDLDLEVKNGNFRADLYHRLSVYPVRVPPLRERGRDILLLTGYFLEGNQRRLGLHRVRLDESSKHLLLSYQWPGNIRELKHLLSRASLKAMKDKSQQDETITIYPKHLGIDDKDISINTLQISLHNESQKLHTKPLSLRDSIDQFQAELIDSKLQQHKNNVAAAARELGVDRGNFSRLIKRLGIR